jgi:hypothetical protein
MFFLTKIVTATTEYKTFKKRPVKEQTRGASAAQLSLSQSLTRYSTPAADAVAADKKGGSKSKKNSDVNIGTGSVGSGGEDDDYTTATFLQKTGKNLVK